MDSRLDPALPGHKAKVLTQQPFDSAANSLVRISGSAEVELD
jgi:hypothetical protein